MKSWVRCPMSPNTLRVHTEYVLIKSVGSKVLWVVTAETTCAGGWRIFPPYPVPCLNCGGGDRWCVATNRKVQPASQALAILIPSLREFHRAKSLID
ncbi:hypothetical protein TNCV_415221 [Trichonephila clavipes]|nr:hypothetical protein TNCV_415221 [Trichonephila clavipes]